MIMNDARALNASVWVAGALLFTSIMCGSESLDGDNINGRGGRGTQTADNFKFSEEEAARLAAAHSDLDKILKDSEKSMDKKLQDSAGKVNICPHCQGQLQPCQHCKDLEQIIKDLQAALEKSKKGMSMSADKLKELEVQLKQHVDESTAIQDENEATLNALTKEGEAKDVEIDKLKAELDRLKKDMDAVLKQKDSYTQKFTNLEKQLADRNKQFEDSNGMIDKLKNELGTMKGNNSSRESNLGKQLDDTNKELDKLREELAMTKDKNTDLESKNKELIEDTISTNNENEEVIAGLEKERNERDAQIERLQKELDDLRKSKSLSASQESAALASQIDSLRNDLENAKRETAEAKKATANVKDEYEELQADHGKLKNKHGNESEKLKKELAIALEKIAELEKTLAQKNNESELFSKDRERLKISEGQVTILKDTIDGLRKRLLEQTETITTLEGTTSTSKDLQAELDTLNKEKVAIERDRDDLRKELARIVAELADTNEAFNEVKNKLMNETDLRESGTFEISELEEVVAGLESERDELTQQLNEYKSKGGGREKELQTEIEITKMNLRETTKAFVEEAKSSKSEIEALKVEIEKLKEAVADSECVQNELEDVVEGLESERADLLKQIEELNKK